MLQLRRDGVCCLATSRANSRRCYKSLARPNVSLDSTCRPRKWLHKSDIPTNNIYFCYCFEYAIIHKKGTANGERYKSHFTQLDVTLSWGVFLNHANFPVTAFDWSQLTWQCYSVEGKRKFVSWCLCLGTNRHKHGASVTERNMAADVNDFAISTFFSFLT
jgi:hypothetical protein